MPTLAVVIPSFQREAGILARALGCVFDQTGLDGVGLEVVVDDDESPADVGAELELVGAERAARVRVVRQKNSGPGGARNTGLDNLTPGTRYVAFLDSDDLWSEDHLARAVGALERGFDLYCANWTPDHDSRDAYSLWNRVNIDDHEPLDPDSTIFSYRGRFIRQELLGPIARLSTMVYRYDAFPDVRFDPGLRNASEDRLFRLVIASRNPRVCFSTKVESTTGSGVNIFAGAEAGTARMLDIVNNQTTFAKRVASDFPLTDDERAIARHMIAQRRRSFAYHYLLHVQDTRRLHLGRLARHIRLDPGAIFVIPSVLWDYVRKRGRPVSATGGAS